MKKYKKKKKKKRNHHFPKAKLELIEWVQKCDVQIVEQLHVYQSWNIARKRARNCRRGEPKANHANTHIQANDQ